MDRIMKKILFKWLFISLLVMVSFTLSWAGSGDPVLENKAITGTLGFDTGTTINEFSTDGTFAGNSDDALPTEKAVKTYGDANWGGSVPAGSQGDMLYKGASAWLAIAGTYNVKAYGTVGDGINDDTAAIQAAIDAAEAAGGGQVFFPTGTYKTSSQLTINSNNVWLMGAGIGASTIKRASAFTTGDTVEFSGVGYGGMRDITIDSTSRMTADAHIHLNASNEQLLFTRLHILNGNIGFLLNSYSVAFMSHIHVKVGSLYATNRADAYVKILGLNAIHVDHCNFAKNSTGLANYGFYITGMDGMWVNDIHIGGVKYAGMHFEPTGTAQCSGIRLSSLWIEVNGTEATTNSINFHGTTTGRYGMINISDSYLQGSGSGGTPNFGIHLNAAALYAVDIQDNTIRHHQKHAIKAESFAGALNIKGNTMYWNGRGQYNTWDAIYIAANKNDFSISDNYIGGGDTGPTSPSAGSERYGIYVAAGTSNYYSIIDNRMNHIGQAAGISDNGTGATKLVTNNLVGN